jgi:hypothetical protein
MREKSSEHKPLQPRESDNPIVEEYKEELLRRPTFGARSPLADEERLTRLEGFLAEMQERIAALERRLEMLEGRR